MEIQRWGVIRLVYAVCCAAFLLILMATYSVPYVTIVGAGCLVLFGYALLVVSVLFSIIIYLRKRKVKYLVSTGITIITLLFSKKYYAIERLDFYINFTDRTNIVEMIQDNKKAFAEEGTCAIPERYCNHILSQSNQVSVYDIEGEVAVYFYYFQGLLEDSKGFLYADPEVDWEILDMDKLIDFGNGWYYCKNK